MAGLLKWLVLTMGGVCAAIGIVHLALGIDSVPGEGAAGATVDSRERFYGAIFLGYGLAWIRAARQSPIPATAVRWLAFVLLLGGIGRLLVHGRPRPAALVPGRPDGHRIRAAASVLLALGRRRKGAV
ncbi:DUF4345 domain-containing protein [Streptomyces sp. NPDC017056]|uniref:DUF4345 domain-containing protein n=1 Tax=Streptomyces sp. NPDC017056 TaxID=3364973 RepID=UPI0037B380FD